VGLFVVIGLILAAGGAFVYFKAKEAGFDPALMSRDPAAAITKLLAATHPDLEVISVDEDKQRVTLRKKSSGKYISISLQDIQGGKLSIDMEDEGRVVIGGDAKPPSWIPGYPNSTPQSSISGENREGEGGMFHFTTNDSADEVLAFYERELKSRGFRIESRTAGSAGIAGGGLLVLKHEDGRGVTVTAGSEGSSTKVAVMYGAK
jgi:hypothetical protein